MWTLIAMLVTHFVADFLLQSREMGKKKSSEPKWLLAHLAIQFACFLLYGWKFALLNTLVHGAIDWHIWRLYKLSVYVRIKRSVAKLEQTFAKKEGVAAWFTEAQREQQYDHEANTWQYWEDHWFYATIGLDQLLHMITIVVLFFAGV